MTFVVPLFLVPAVACLAAAFLLRDARRADGWTRVMSAPVLALLRPAEGRLGPNLPLLLLAVVLAALASPSVRSAASDSYALDDGILVMVDVSRSMTLDDVRPDRMSAARAAALSLSARAGARPTAMIVYSGDAYLAEPFATDRRQFDAYAGALAHGLLPFEGSDVGRALSLATSVLAQSGIGHARLVLVTDGGGIEPATVDIARRLAALGHRLDVVFCADPRTESPVKVDPGLIETVATAGGGRVVPVDATGNAPLERLNLEPGFWGRGSPLRLALVSTEWRNLSHYMLIGALPLLLLLFARRTA